MDLANEDARRRWVLDRRVWAEVVASDAVAGHRDDWGPSGLCVRLYARCPEAHLDPAGRAVRDVHETLGRLLVDAMPGTLRCRVRAAEPALHLRPETELTAEVELVAEIDAEGDSLSRVAPEERRAARELMATLARMGVRSHGPVAA
jgi:hypothetical protein